MPPAPRPARLRCLILAAALLVLAVLAVRMLAGARTELGRAALAARRGDSLQEVRHLRRALAYYVPGNPWARQAQRDLLDRARAARRRGDAALASRAYGELRSAMLGVRHVTQPFAADLPEVNRAIAELAARDPRAAHALRDPAGLERRLAHPAGPRAGWAALGVLGFAGWVVAAVMLLLVGLRADASPAPRRFWPLAGLAALGVAACYAGLALA